MMNEEIKQVSLRSNQFNPNTNYSRPITELSINFENYRQPSINTNLKENEVISKTKNIIKNRRKYKAS